MAHGVAVLTSATLVLGGGMDVGVDAVVDGAVGDVDCAFPELGLGSRM